MYVCRRTRTTADCGTHRLILFLRVFEFEGDIDNDEWCVRDTGRVSDRQVRRREAESTTDTSSDVLEGETR